MNERKLLQENCTLKILLTQIIDVNNKNIDDKKVNKEVKNYLKKMNNALEETLGLKKILEKENINFGGINQKQALLNIASQLQKQLQAYKDKEDRLREYISELSSEEILLKQGFDPVYVKGIIFAYDITKEDVLQILNEGE